jgi:hypothetical protein
LFIPFGTEGSEGGVGSVKGERGEWKVKEPNPDSDIGDDDE